MSRARMAMMMLALAVPLGGCQSIFGGKVAVRPAEGAARLGGDAAYAAAQLEAGRKALGEGQLSAAITAFRNARLYPEQTAAATNGLAIAYSQLGRADLAERYFRQAVAMAPRDRRYQANLQRFYRLNPVELTMSADARPTPASPVPATETRMRLTSQTGAPTTVVVSRPTSRLVRLSASEVRVGGGGDARTAAGAAMARVAKRQAGGAAATGYPVRVGFAPREVFVGKAPPAAAPRPQVAVEVAAKQQYPLRVRIGSR